MIVSDSLPLTVARRFVPSFRRVPRAFCISHEADFGRPLDIQPFVTAGDPNDRVAFFVPVSGLGLSFDPPMETRSSNCADYKPGKSIIKTDHKLITRDYGGRQLTWGSFMGAVTVWPNGPCNNALFCT